MLHLFAWLVASPNPLATPVAIDPVKAVHNLEVLAGQVGAGVIGIILVVAGVKSALRGQVLGIVTAFALAIPCIAFVLVPTVVIGIALSLIGTVTGQ